MYKADLKRSLEAELLKIERQDKKIYSVGETRYDLMIRDVLNYIHNSISNEVIENKKNQMIEEYKEIIETNSTKAFIMKCQIEFAEELLKGGENK